MMEEGLFKAATESNLEMLNLDAIDEQAYTVHYPYVNERNAQGGREEGFKWFESNRAAFKFKNNSRECLDINSINKYPGERKQVPFREYMQAPEPLLKANFITASRNTGNWYDERPTSKTVQRSTM